MAKILQRPNGEQQSKTETRCNRKKRFPNLQSALNEAKYLNAQKGIQVWPYKCKWCTKYHNGTSYGAKHETN